ncbi:response regulator [Neobacillus sp. 114]|uniref:response regulator n=1 Tax=Neobacillus sp. 114 TaxID=3048535 RepID=UPI0024C3E5E6|nr:response regulator [Neobacillus sp. 114]
MSNGKILIVENERKIARLIHLELEHEGYETVTAYTGLEDYSLFQQENWDLLLLDGILPELSGLELLRRIRSAYNQTPVIENAKKRCMGTVLMHLSFQNKTIMIHKRTAPTSHPILIRVIHSFDMLAV